jgi:hypothetical protein
MRCDASAYLVIGVLLLVSDAQGADVPTAEQLERTALASRQQIRTMSVRLTAQARGSHTGENVWHLWWEGPERQRGDLTRSSLPPEGVRIIHAVGVERSGWSLFLEDRKHVCAPFHKASQSEVANSLFATVDPRYIGYTNDDTITYRALENSVFGRSDRSLPTVERLDHDGRDCWLVKWKTKLGVDFKVVFDPHRGGNPVHFDVNYSLPDGRKGREVSEIDLSQYGPGKVWYPSKMSYEQKFGDRVQRSETVTFDQVTINEPIPAEVFTLKGLGLQEGQPFCLPNGDPLGPVAIWKDGKLQRRPDDKANKFDAVEPVPISGGGAINPWLVVACAVCSLGALALLVFRWRRSKKE